MNKTKIGIFLSLMLVLGFCSSCGEKKAMTTVYTAHGLKYSINHTAAPTLQVAI